MNRLLFFLLLINYTASYAQQPAYFVLGENQFKGIKVFDIIQDLEQNYYFATNEGIIKYDFINYTKVEVKSAKSIAFFNFTISKNGTIYFNNLNNQIFALKRGKCKLFYELDEKLSSNLINLINDDHGNLIVGCKGILVLDTAAKIITQKIENNVFYTSYKLNQKTWLFPCNNASSVLLYVNGKIIEKKIKRSDYHSNHHEMLQFFNYRDSSYVLDLISKSLYLFDTLNWALLPIKTNDFFNSNSNARLFITSNKIWSPTSISGINFNDKHINASFKNYYKDFFISDVYQDMEGNILLGTFDKGVLVISDVKIPDVINSFSEDPMLSILADHEQKIYLGSNKGIMHVYENNVLKIITNKSKKAIDGIYGSPQSDFLIFDNEKIKCYNKKTKEIFDFSNNSLKDVAFVSPNEIFIGTNVGIFKVKFNRPNQFILKPINAINFRIYALAFNPQNGFLYASTANGLFAIDPSGSIKKVKYKGRDVFSEKIIFINGILYVVLRETGILTLDNSKHFNLIKPQFPGVDEEIKHILIYKNSIVASTSKGLYQMNSKGKILNQFHSVYGFATKKVYNFSISSHFLWVSHSGGVQKIDLNHTNLEGFAPQINFKELKVNNQLVNLNTTKNFKSSQRKFEFVIYSPTLRNAENITYHYKLIGYDDQWQSQNYKLNNITYNALSPGKYTLVIKAENLGKFSPEKKYTFTISTPIYAKTWFILSSIGLFIFTVLFIYRRQLQSQKRKSKQINELNLSKLTAIQSQMNPHFIFNSLNSIQDLVLQQNAPKAYDSIGKFALLIRKIMHHSEKEFIDIEEEISIINVYLELELLRLKTDFSYTINSHDISDIEIPPMLIQPFIENAIKHGLLHKSGEKKLLIEMTLEHNVFVCEITDNGVGRKKSQEIKDRQKNRHESFSGDSLTKRLTILKKHFGGDFGVEIIDLYDHENNAIGTKVILKAPYKQKY